MTSMDLAKQRNDLKPERFVKDDNISPIGELAVYYQNSPKTQALLQLVPSWGVADTLLQQRAEEIKRERMRTFFDELARGEHELTEELIQSEDFLHCFFRTARAAFNTRQREKIKMFARF